MVVEFISYPSPKICDQAVAQTYNPGIEVRFNNNNRRNTECALLQVNCVMTVHPFNVRDKCMHTAKLNFYILSISNDFSEYA